MGPTSACHRFEGQLCVVTGSTAGIGLAIAARLLDEGGVVIVSSRRAPHVKNAVETLEKASAVGKVFGLVCDVQNKSDRQALLNFSLNKSGRSKIDVLVSNVACSPYFGMTIETPEAAWNKLFAVNVTAAFFLVCEAQQYLADKAAVLFVSSHIGFNPMQPIGAYGVTKTALLGLTKALANDLASRQIRVNCLAPGVVQTKFSRALWENPATLEISQGHCSMGRTALPEEIAGPAAFLCSRDASYITGETLSVAGGIQSRL